MLNPVSFYRAARWAHLHKLHTLARLISGISELMFHCYLPASAQIGRGFEVGYRGCGVVVHARACLAENVFMGPGAIIGGRSQHPGVPQIGRNVYIAPGAKVLGEIVVGDGVVIGANAVVIESVPDNCIVAGVPAKIIRRNIRSFDYTGWPADNRDKQLSGNHERECSDAIEEINAHFRND
jgi:serine O-acetyltransferase